jgi:hypothetical protein
MDNLGVETDRGNAFMSLKKFRKFLVHWVLGFLSRIKVAGASGWPPALAGEKVRDERFNLYSRCVPLWLHHKQLYTYFYMHFSVVQYGACGGVVVKALRY